MKYPAVILAGGSSTRLGGGDKCLLPLGRASILAEIINILVPQVSGIAINSNSDPHLFDETGLDVFCDVMPGRLGPLAGILTAMQWAQTSGASHVLTVACDTPFLPRDLGARLVACAHGDVVVAASAGRIHPTVGLWAVRYAEKLKHDLENGTRRVHGWLETVPFTVVEFSCDPVDPFWNINTHSDWEAAVLSRHNVGHLAQDRSIFPAKAGGKPEGPGDWPSSP
jgi:molybdopterin-guanine dinucleotide biosynthesis protein A